mmetsp:Transcript_37851/g.88499  ORF Transcript_37851/g.88499 Transcript_37851/m.88499 type:complete len:259 (+) Transcript_37851:834-1610(+)
MSFECTGHGEHAGSRLVGRHSVFRIVSCGNKLGSRPGVMQLDVRRNARQADETPATYEDNLRRYGGVFPRGVQDVQRDQVRHGAPSTDEKTATPKIEETDGPSRLSPSGVENEKDERESVDDEDESWPAREGDGEIDENCFDELCDEVVVWCEGEVKVRVNEVARVSEGRSGRQVENKSVEGDKRGHGLCELETVDGLPAWERSTERPHHPLGPQQLIGCGGFVPQYLAGVISLDRPHPDVVGVSLSTARRQHRRCDE